jgi:hypothetical protein
MRDRYLPHHHKPGHNPHHEGGSYKVSYVPTQKSVGCCSWYRPGRNHRWVPEYIPRCGGAFRRSGGLYKGPDRCACSCRLGWWPRLGRAPEPPRNGLAQRKENSVGHHQRLRKQPGDCLIRRRQRASAALVIGPPVGAPRSRKAGAIRFP